jgi:hypothetical protein
LIALQAKEKRDAFLLLSLKPFGLRKCSTLKSCASIYNENKLTVKGLIINWRLCFGGISDFLFIVFYRN